MLLRLIILLLSTSSLFSAGYWKVINKEPVTNNPAWLYSFNDSTFIYQCQIPTIENSKLVKEYVKIRKTKDGGKTFYDALSIERVDLDTVPQGIPKELCNSLFTRILFTSKDGTITIPVYDRQLLIRSYDMGESWHVDTIMPSRDLKYHMTNYWNGAVFNKDIGCFQYENNSGSGKNFLLVSWDGWETVDSLSIPQAYIDEGYKIANMEFVNDSLLSIMIYTYKNDKEFGERFGLVYNRNSELLYEVSYPPNIVFTSFSSTVDEKYYASGYSYDTLSNGDVYFRGQFIVYDRKSDKWTNDLVTVADTSYRFRGVRMLNSDYGHLVDVGRNSTALDREENGVFRVFTTKDGWETFEVSNFKKEKKVYSLDMISIASPKVSYGMKSGFILKYVDETVGIDEPEIERKGFISTYPNPYNGNGELNIRIYPGYSQKGYIRIFDINGETVHQEEIYLQEDQEQIYTWNPQIKLAAGTYYVCLYAMQQRVYSSSFVVE